MGGAGVLQAYDVYVLCGEEAEDGSQFVFGFDYEAAGVESGNGEVAPGAMEGDVKEVCGVSFDVFIHHGCIEVLRGKGREVLVRGVVW
jgi:hypothetical protein